MATTQDLKDSIDRLTSVFTLVEYQRRQREADQRRRDAINSANARRRASQSRNPKNVFGRMARAAKFMGFPGIGKRLQRFSKTRAAGGIQRAGLVVGGLVGSFEALRRATDNQIHSMKDLANASASMAMVMTQRDIQEWRRNKEMGDDLSESARDLVEAEQRRKDATQPITTGINQFKNEVLAGMNHAASYVVEGWVLGFRELKKAMGIKDDVDEKKIKDLTAGEFLREVQKEHEAARRRNDSWFNRPPIRE